MGLEDGETMSAKKFPTPNLDAIKEDDHGKITATSAYRASQADIALAVESARVTVPEGVREAVAWVIEPYFDKPMPCREGLDKATFLREWLESLTVAPKDAPQVALKSWKVLADEQRKRERESEAKPVEKRCGTCARGPVDCGAINCAKGFGYPMWKAKP